MATTSLLISKVPEFSRFQKTCRLPVAFLKRVKGCFNCYAVVVGTEDVKHKIHAFLERGVSHRLWFIVAQSLGGQQPKETQYTLSVGWRTCCHCSQFFHFAHLGLLVGEQCSRTQWIHSGATVQEANGLLSKLPTSFLNLKIQPLHIMHTKACFIAWEIGGFAVLLNKLYGY